MCIMYYACMISYLHKCYANHLFMSHKYCLQNQLTHFKVFSVYIFCTSHFSNMSPVEWEDLLELAERLAKERSFLANEQKQLQQLNEKVNTLSPS
jgi:hypothetical protein